MPKQVQIGEQPLQLQDFSGYKAFKVMRLAKGILASSPQIQAHIAAYVRKYEAENYVELDRAAAMHRFGEDLQHITDADWQASGNKLRLPTSPTSQEISLAAFPVVLDVAEQQAIRLLALIALSNRELEDADNEGGEDAVDQAIEAKAKTLVHRAHAEQLLELFLTGYELVEDQLQDTIKGAEERLGNLMRLLGWGPTSEPPTSSNGTQESPQSPSSSTSSPPDTDGTSEPSSTEPAGAASPSSAT